MIFKRKFTKTFGGKEPYISVENVLQSVIEFCSVKGNDKYTISIHIPSEKHGLPYTDTVEIKYSGCENFKFSIFESEAQDYLYIKNVERMNLVQEISRLRTVSGHLEKNGYEFFSFGEL